MALLHEAKHPSVGKSMGQLIRMTEFLVTDKVADDFGFLSPDRLRKGRAVGSTNSPLQSRAGGRPLVKETVAEQQLISFQVWPQTDHCYSLSDRGYRSALATD